MNQIINFWYFNIASLLVKKPDHKLEFSVKDFELGKKWAKTQRDPSNPKKSLWERCYDKRGDSVQTLNNINKFI